MAVSELPGNPNAVWTVRRHVEGNAFSTLSSSAGWFTGSYLIKTYIVCDMIFFFF